MRVMTAASLKIENFEPRFSKTVSTTKLNSLKRRIDFGQPLDDEKEMRWLHEKLKEQEEMASKLWNFNFREEKTLDPEGNFLWVPVDRPIVNDTSKCDDKFKFQPIDPVKTTAVASSGKCHLKQKSITDFMPSAKNRQMNVKDTSSERPSKIRRLGDCSS